MPYLHVTIFKYCPVAWQK